ncbi:MAG: hypothetical protein WAT56_07375 [Candidatus Microthrix parvicella]
MADASFDEGLDEHGDEVATEHAFDAGWVVEEHGCDESGAFELCVSLFEVGLPVVGGE